MTKILLTPNLYLLLLLNLAGWSLSCA